MNDVSVEDLTAKGLKVYSFSKLGTFNNCQYEYYNTYILKNNGLENCYTILGSTIHNGIESVYLGEQDETTFQNHYYNKLTELELLGIDFPNEKIKANWVSDVNHFYENFKKIDRKMLLEKHIVFEVTDGIWIQGYIDAISPSDLGKPYIDILDWKTSSRFTGKKLTEAGRQLLMYKVGLERTSNFKVNKVAWFMIKYIYVCSSAKSKVKKKMCNRGKWVKEMRGTLEKDLLKLQMDAFEIELLLDQAVEDNNISCLPEAIRNKYWLEDCIVEYEITEERINECKEYIKNTVNLIENKNAENEIEWEPIEINSKSSFYCSVLCGHRKKCKFYKQYIEENANKFDNKPKKDDFSMFS